MGDSIQSKCLQGILVWCAAMGMLLVCVVTMWHRPMRNAEIAATESVAYQIDPNTADFDTLCLLPRIGASGMAQRILHDRQANGPYGRVEDLARVPMIGPKTVEALRPWVRFASTSLAAPEQGH